MSKRNRVPAESDVYHVIIRGVERRDIFLDDRCRHRYLDILDRSMASFNCDLYAWCLMTNHVHLLLRIGFDDLAKLMQRHDGSYSQYFNWRYGRVGPLYDGPYTSIPVEDDAYLTEVVCYIHNNPVKAGIVTTPGEYPWSSYSDYLRAPEPTRTSTAEVLNLFGGIDAFREAHAREPQAVCRENDNVFIDDTTAETLLTSALEACGVTSLKDLARPRRDEMVIDLRERGITVRQIMELTGLSRDVIYRARTREGLTFSARMLRKGQASCGSSAKPTR